MGREIETFQKRLEECIRVEDYEQAAVYRDEIRRLQTELREEGQANGENSSWMKEEGPPRAI